MELTPADLSNDLDIVDDLRAVDVVRADPETGAEVERAVGVTVVRRQTQDVEPDVEGGGVPATRCRWHLKAVDMHFTPKQRDRIVDADGAVWVIPPKSTVQRLGFGTRYVCDTVEYQG